MNAVINAEGIGKRYNLRHERKQNYQALRDVVSKGMKKWGDRIIHPFAPFHTPACINEVFWALRDVSFEIRTGERVGIIGRNGAGKSTLLKILSRITEPTEGLFRLRGRVASLLEVGTGFHPELTGRENIFLNGAILGMTKAEIKGRFDQIVSFSEMEKFLDTPVKRYSSGMYTRLAFAVAAHLEPEILIVDEVLAVGDAQFQKKCLGKMGEVSKEGRTVLFVSHNMQAIRQLCSRSILLQEGRIVIDDTPLKVIDRYVKDGAGKVDAEGSALDIIRNLPADPVFKLESISLTQAGRPITASAVSGKPIEIEIRYQVLERTTGLRVYFDLCDDQDTLLFRSFHDEDSDGIPVMDPGTYSSRAIIPANLLGPTKYEIRVRATIFNVRSCLPASGIRFAFEVEPTGRYNRAYLGDTFRGKLGATLSWTTTKR